MIWFFVICAVIGAFAWAYNNGHQGRKRHYENEGKDEQLKQQVIKEGFNPEKFYHAYDHNSALFIDTEKAELCFAKLDKGNKIFGINDIIEFEVMVDGNAVTKVNKTQLLSGAAIGGALFGGAGAVVGSLAADRTTSNSKPNSIDLKFLVDDIEQPNIKMNLFTLTDIGTYLYDDVDWSKKAFTVTEEIFGTLKVLIHRSNAS